jgi:hypothetical protein
MYGNQRDKLILCLDYYFLNKFQLAKLLEFLISFNTLFSFQIIFVHSATSTSVSGHQVTKVHCEYKEMICLHDYINFQTAGSVYFRIFLIADKNQTN